MITTSRAARDVLKAILGSMLHSLSARQRYAIAPGAGLPDATIYVEERGVVLSVTSEAAPRYRADIEALAHEMTYDVALIRFIGRDSDFVHLTVDLTLGLLPCQPFSMTDLRLWTGRDGDTWLVPETFGPAVSLSEVGFSLELLAPYDTQAQRSAGIFRAAGNIARLLQPAVVR